MGSEMCIRDRYSEFRVLDFSNHTDSASQDIPVMQAIVLRHTTIKGISPPEIEGTLMDVLLLTREDGGTITAMSPTSTVYTILVHIPHMLMV